MIEEEDIETFKEITTASSLTNAIQLKMKNMCIKYKFGNCNICGGCNDRAVKDMWSNIKIFYQRNV